MICSSAFFPGGCWQGELSAYFLCPKDSDSEILLFGIQGEILMMTRKIFLLMNVRLEKHLALGPLEGEICIHPICLVWSVFYMWDLGVAEVLCFWQTPQTDACKGLTTSLFFCSKASGEIWGREALPNKKGASDFGRKMRNCLDRCSISSAWLYLLPEGHAWCFFLPYHICRLHHYSPEG